MTDKAESIRIATCFLNSLPSGLNRTGLLLNALDFRSNHASNPDLCAVVNIGIAVALYSTGGLKANGFHIKREMQRLLHASINESTDDYRTQSRAMANTAFYDCTKDPRVIKDIMSRQALPREESSRMQTQHWALWSAVNIVSDRLVERKPLIQSGETFEFVPLSEAIQWTTDEFLERAHTLLPLCACDMQDPLLMSQIIKNDARSLKRVERHFQASTNNALCQTADALDRMDTCDQSDHFKMLLYMFAYFSVKSFVLEENVCDLPSLSVTWTNTLLVLQYSIQRLCDQHVRVVRVDGPKKVDCIISLGLLLQSHLSNFDHLVKSLRAAVALDVGDTDPDILSHAIDTLEDGGVMLPGWLRNSRLFASYADEEWCECKELPLYRDPTIRNSIDSARDALRQLSDALSDSREDSAKNCVAMLRSAYDNESVHVEFPDLRHLFDLTFWRLDSWLLSQKKKEKTSACADDIFNSIRWTIRSGYKTKYKDIGRLETANLRTATTCAFFRYMDDSASARRLFSFRFESGRPSLVVVRHRILYRQRQLSGGRPLRAVEGNLAMQRLSPSLEIHDLVNAIPLNECEDGEGFEGFANGMYYSATPLYSILHDVACQARDATDADTRYFYHLMLGRILDDGDVQRYLLGNEDVAPSWDSVLSIWFGAQAELYESFQKSSNCNLHLNHEGVRQILRALAFFAHDGERKRLMLAHDISKQKEVARQLKSLGSLPEFLDKLIAEYEIETVPRYECVTSLVSNAIKNVVRAEVERRRVESKRAKKQSKKVKRALLKGYCPAPTSTSPTAHEDGEDDGLDDLSLQLGAVNLTSAWEEMARPKPRLPNYEVKLKSDRKAATILTKVVRGFIARRKLRELKALARFNHQTSFSSVVVRAPPPAPPQPPPPQLETVTAPIPDVKSFRSRKLCRNGPNCKYGDRCHFYHPPPPLPPSPPPPPPPPPAEKEKGANQTAPNPLECPICLNDMHCKIAACCGHVYCSTCVPKVGRACFVCATTVAAHIKLFL